MTWPKAPRPDHHDRVEPVQKPRLRATEKIHAAAALLDLRNTYDTDRVVSFGFRHISVGRPTKDPVA